MSKLRIKCLSMREVERVILDAQEIMSKLRIKCLSMREVERVILDAQEILSHVEFGSLRNGVLTLFYEM